jgi:hypothetical protein
MLDLRSLGGGASPVFSIHHGVLLCCVIGHRLASVFGLRQSFGGQVRLPSTVFRLRATSHPLDLSAVALAKEDPARSRSIPLDPARPVRRSLLLR